MSKGDSQPCWCHCSRCRKFGPQGALQTQRTSRKHCDDDDRRMGLPRGTTWRRDEGRNPFAALFGESLGIHEGSVMDVEAGFEGDIEEANDDLKDNSSDDGQPFAFSTLHMVEDDASTDGSARLWQDFNTSVDNFGTGSMRYGLFSSDSEDADVPFTAARSPSPPLSIHEESESDNASESDLGVFNDITADPLFHSRQDIFNQDDANRDEPDSDIPWALADHPAVRNMYIRVFLGVAFDGMTHKAASLMLNGFANAFRSLSVPGVDIPGLANFARTIGTVERRLGVSTNGFIIYLVACPDCWHSLDPANLETLVSPSCLTLDCPGVLYTTKRLSNGKEKRTPCLIIPYVPPSRAIQRMCLHPGKVSQWQEWRRAEDAPDSRSPTTATGYAAYDNPDTLLHDVTDAWGWRAIQAGLERRRNGIWEVRDVDVHEVSQQFVALSNGLVLQMNLDWFQAVKGGVHSTGAVYVTICNNPRPVRYLREETQLTFVFPGPQEPNLEQMKHPLRFFIDDLKRLYQGVELRVYGEDVPQLFHTQLYHDLSDLPASRKFDGLQSFSSTYFMCHLCTAEFYTLTDPASFQSDAHECRDPWRYLKYSFRGRDVGEEIAEEIYRRRGVRYAPVHELANWLPGCSSPLDFMHLFFLCLQKHTAKSILFGNGMLTNAAQSKLSTFFENLVWPSSVSRLPPSIARAGGSVKADQWKSFGAIFFVALFVAWEVDGGIPDIDAPPPAKNTKIEASMISQHKLVWKRLRSRLLAENPNLSPEELPSLDDTKMDRSLRKHYDVVLQYAVARRILSSHAISPVEIQRGCAALNRATQSLARMKAHLTPYFHLATHLEKQFLKLGPSPGFGVYPYERNNRTLGRFNKNGHSGGELEGTMMRGWWKTTFIQELISHLECLPRPWARDDSESIELLKSYLQGGNRERQGTLQAYIERIQAMSNPDCIEFPRFPSEVNLRQIGQGIYNLVFGYLRRVWERNFDLVTDVALITRPASQVSFFDSVKSFSHIWLSRRRFGAGTSARGHSARYAYMDSRIPL